MAGGHPAERARGLFMIPKLCSATALNECRECQEISFAQSSQLHSPSQLYDLYITILPSQLHLQKKTFVSISVSQRWQVAPLTMFHRALCNPLLAYELAAPTRESYLRCLLRIIVSRSGDSLQPPCLCLRYKQCMHHMPLFKQLLKPRDYFRMSSKRMTRSTKS